MSKTIVSSAHRRISFSTVTISILGLTGLRLEIFRSYQDGAEASAKGATSFGEGFAPHQRRGRICIRRSRQETGEGTTPSIGIIWFAGHVAGFDRRECGTSLVWSLIVPLAQSYPSSNRALSVCSLIVNSADRNLIGDYISVSHKLHFGLPTTGSHHWSAV